MERASASASSRERRGFERALGGEVDERADGDGDADEHDERDQVLGGADRQGAVGRHEEPVEEQRSDDRGDHTDEQSTDGRDGQHDDEREQEFGRQVDRVAERKGQCDEQGQADDHEDPPDRGAPVDDRTACGDVDVAGWAVSVRAMTWTSTSGARRVTRATNDPWTSSCHRLRRLAPSTSCVAFSRRANAAIASAVSGATTSWTVPPSSRTSFRCAASASWLCCDKPVVDRDVHARRARRRPGRPCVPHGGSTPRRRRRRSCRRRPARGSPTGRRCRGRRGSR